MTTFTEAVQNAGATVTDDELPSIADSAMLAILRRKPLQTVRRMDDLAQEEVRQFLGDEGATVSTHLFRDKASPVRELITMDGRAYTFHRKHTLAWVDNGPRLLLSAKFDFYRQATAQLQSEQEQFLNQQVLPHWNELVERDVKFRQQAAYSISDPVRRQQKLDMISPDEYPSEEEIASKFTLQFRLRLIGGDDARVKLSADAVRQAREDFRAEMQDAVRGASRDMAKRMVVPIEKAIEKLKVPIDEKGSIFRDSLIENLYDAVENVRSFGFTDDPQLAEAVRQAELYINGQMPSAESLRTQQHARDSAVNNLDELAKIFTNLQ